MQPLKKYRQRMDALDQKIVGLLRKRARLSRTIQQFKTRNGMPKKDAARENEILGKVLRNGRGYFSSGQLKRVYIQIIALTRGR